MRKRGHYLAFAMGACGASLGVAMTGCGAFTGVDWDRVVAEDAGLLPDGAPGPTGDDEGGTGGGDGGNGGSDGGGGNDGGGGGTDSGPIVCNLPKIRCVLGCCDDTQDNGFPSTLTAGEADTCATSTTGTVLCWGLGNTGQLGRGTADDSLVPVRVYNMPQAVTAAAIGSSHGCAVVGNAIGCWGANANGQLGFDQTPTTNGIEPPGRVTNITGNAIQIAVGDLFSCANVDGSVYCWGDNSYGQLAAPASVILSSTPRSVAQIGTGVLAIGAQGNEACAVASDGTVYCWGGEASSPPTVKAGITKASQIVLGSGHKCALAQGTVLCWGENLYAELGNNDADGVTPTAPTGLPTTVAQLTAGGMHTCAIAGTDVWCWGSNVSGEIGRDDTVTRGLPAVVTDIAGSSAVAAGESHTCALGANSKIKCFGSNSFGQFGNGTKDSNYVPVEVSWP